jgi:hypothetical protein
MKTWRKLAIATAIGAGVSLPVYAADGDALQSYENQHGNAVERNVVVSPTPTQTTPSWNGANEPLLRDRTLARPDTSIDRGPITAPAPTTMSSDGSTVVSPSMSTPSAAAETDVTGKVDADTATPPQTGADVQAGDMGPSSPKAGGGATGG